MYRFIGIVWMMIAVSVGTFAADAGQTAKELANQLRDGLSGRTLKTIAFLELEGPEKSQFGDYMTDKLINAFQRETHVSIFTRLQIEALIKEHKLNLTGIIDPATTKKFGQMAQVDALATGKYIIFGENVEISVQVFDVRTAQQIASAEATLAKTKDISNLLSEVIISQKEGMPDVSKDKVDVSSVDDVYFSAIRVVREGNKLYYTVGVINNGVKRRILVKASNALMNVDGVVVKANEILHAGSKTRHVIHDLPSGVKAEITFAFYDVLAEGKTATHLDIDFDLNGDRKNIELRNVPIR